MNAWLTDCIKGTALIYVNGVVDIYRERKSKRERRVHLSAHISFDKCVKKKKTWIYCLRVQPLYWAAAVAVAAAMKVIFEMFHFMSQISCMGISQALAVIEALPVQIGSKKS